MIPHYFLVRSLKTTLVAHTASQFTLFLQMRLQLATCDHSVTLVGARNFEILTFSILLVHTEVFVQFSQFTRPLASVLFLRAPYQQLVYFPLSPLVQKSSEFHVAKGASFLILLYPAYTRGTEQVSTATGQMGVAQYEQTNGAFVFLRWCFDKFDVVSAIR